MNRRDALKETLRRIVAEREAAELAEQSYFVPVLVDLLSDGNTIESRFEPIAELCHES